MNAVKNAIKSAIGVLAVSAVILSSEQVLAGHHSGANEAFSDGGAPNLVVVDLKRNNRGLTNARAESRVNVRVTVANDEPFGMSNNEASGGTWHINVQGDTRPQQMRRALPGKSSSPSNRSNQYSYNTNIALACYTSKEDKYGAVRVRVDSGNNIRESNEKDNERVFQIERNRCRDAG